MSSIPKTDIPDIAATLAVDLRVLIGTLVRRVREQRGPSDLSWPQMQVLGQLERDGPATVTVLARKQNIKPQSMGATVASLEKAGLITGEPDPQDGRAMILSLTPTGRTLILATRAAREDWLQRAISAEFSSEEQHDIAGAIKLLKRLVD